MRHLLISYHTCPTERPGQDLAGGMNVLLQGFLRHTRWPTDVVTRSFALYERYKLTPHVVVHRLPCGARRPWTRDLAWGCLEAFRESFRHWLSGREYEVASAHYWMSGMLLSELACPAGMMFHTLQVQKGAPSDPLEVLRQAEEARLASRYPTAFSHWHDLRDAKGRLTDVCRPSVVRPGVEDELFGQLRPRGAPSVFGWAARSDAIKNFEQALAWLDRLRAGRPDVVLRVAGMSGASRPGVSYLGPLIPEEMAGFYGGIDQLWNFSRYETFGLSLLEALAQGATVGLNRDCDWARRLSRLAIDSAVGRDWSGAERQRALRLSRAYSWRRALPSWERWLSRVAKDSSLS